MPNQSHHTFKTAVARATAWIGLASSLVWVLDIVSYFVIVKFWIGAYDLGTATLATGLFIILDKATDLGLSAAVIQRDDHDEDKLSTVFWINVLLSGAATAILAYVVGPVLSWSSGEPIVTDLLSVYGIKLLWHNVYFVPDALMRKQLRFKELSILRTFANIAEFVAKIVTAKYFGLWCFVIGPMCRSFITGIGIQICHPWRPRFVVRLRHTWDWVVFGVKASTSQILFHIYTNVDYYIVGPVFGNTALGIYRLAYEIALDPCRLISDALHQIAFPAYSRIKRARERLVEQLIAFTRLSMILMIGFVGIVFVSADELVVLINDEYAAAAGAAKILCIVGVFRALSVIVPPLLDAIGRPGLSLIYMLVAALVLPVFFLASAYLAAPLVTSALIPDAADGLGFMSIVYAWLVGYPIAFLVLFGMALHQLRLGVFTYIRRVIGVALCASVSIAVALMVHDLAADLEPLASVVASSATMITTFIVLLAYTQGISPRTIGKSLRG